MKPQIKVTKTLANGNGLTVTESWITNGHWMLSRDRDSNQALLTSEETVEAFGIPYQSRGEATDEELVRAMPSDAPHEFIVSEWVKDAQQKRFPVLRRLDGPEVDGQTAHAFLNAKYATGIGIEVGDILYSSRADGTGRLRSEDSTLVIMPVRS